ncbi:MAG: nucleoside-diphosphate sugar epimerase/dehydratase [Elusimicrobiota bacterium]|nr:nucleoside-diphosphate sugar epimerase/dehydratase [Elusimicrobiota bacterium]
MTHQSFLKGYDFPVMNDSSAVAARRMLVMALDLCCILAAYGLAFLLRFDFDLDAYHSGILLTTSPYGVLTYALASYYFGVHRGLRHFSSFGDVVNIAKAIGLTALIQGVLVLFVTQGMFPRSVLILSPILSFLMIGALHAFGRYFKAYWRERSVDLSTLRTAVIVGAGDVGELVYRQLRTDDHVNYRIVAFFDEDSAKWGMRLHGVPVTGPISNLAEFLRKHPVDEVVVAVSSARGQAVSAVAEVLRKLEKRPLIKVAPSLDEMLRSSSAGANPRKVQPSDLLNRKEVRLDAMRIMRSLEGKTVLVTGAGGTIGGELSRQVVAYRPKTVLLLEQHATALFYREAELREKMPGVKVVSVLGDIRDQSLLDRIFREHRIQAVFHAAAHKHVVQLESNIQEGVSNNVLGTYHLASQADKYGVETFLFVSTDKAVRPSCVMGATKRAAEMVICDFARRSKTRFMSVRFGNVLGSSGSVLKIFQEQIEQGRPVTITHPDATRYFMTVEEAVGLMLQASVLAKGGEVFVLRMGEPVRIMDMARNLILLSGLEPGRDIQIHITGLKPGEKISEELVEDPAGQEGSEHDDIMVLRSENKPVDGLPEKIFGVEVMSRSANNAAMVRELMHLVPTYTADPVHDEMPIPVDLTIPELS